MIFSKNKPKVQNRIAIINTELDRIVINHAKNKMTGEEIPPPISACDINYYRDLAGKLAVEITWETDD